MVVYLALTNAAIAWHAHSTFRPGMMTSRTQPIVMITDQGMQTVLDTIHDLKAKILSLEAQVTEARATQLVQCESGDTDACSQISQENEAKREWLAKVGFGEDQAKKVWLSRLDVPWDKGVVAPVNQASAQSVSEEEAKKAWLVSLGAPTWGKSTSAISEIAKEALMVEQMYGAGRMSEEEAKKAWLSKLDAPTWGKTAAAVASFADDFVVSDRPSEEEAKRAWLSAIVQPRGVSRTRPNANHGRATAGRRRQEPGVVLHGGGKRSSVQCIQSTSIIRSKY